MKIRTIFIVFLLSVLTLGSQSCKTKEIATTDEAVQKELYKKKKKEARAAKKLKRKREKHYWSLQSKEVKKSIKRNRRYQKRKARKLKKNEQFNDN